MVEDGSLNSAIMNVSQSGTMPTMSAGDFNGDGFDDLIFSDYHGTVAAIFKTEDSWHFEVIANNIDKNTDNIQSTGTIVHHDGQETLITSLLPTPEDGYLNHTIMNQSLAGTMPTMDVGDFNGDGLDDIIFSDYQGTIVQLEIV